METEHAKLLIIGSGPAGYTAAIYPARAELAPVMLAGLEFGGQLMITTDVENYPGFPEGVTGPAMMEMFQQQAERFGTRVLLEDATGVDFSSRPFIVETESRRFSADSIVVATGASARWLGIESEQRLVNNGVSACGGDTAMEEALFLTRFASRVTIVHRRDELRASRIMQERAFKNEKIEFAWNATVAEVLGTEAEGVTGLRLEDVHSHETRELEVGAVFVAIGHHPNTALFSGVLDADEAGYLKVQPGSARTSLEGVFACGDVADPHYRQAVTAAGTGCMAAIDAERWLAEQEID